MWYISSVQDVAGTEPMPLIPHFNKIDTKSIRAQFFAGRQHRASLFLPYVGSPSRRTLCVIGQNPSAADGERADKTIRYLEELIFRKAPEHGALLMLNLCSQVDTKKALAGAPLHPRCAEIFDAALQDHEDFLIVCGKSRNEGS